SMPTPLQYIDTARIHLYSKYDTLWYRSPFVFREREGVPRSYEVLGEWRPGVEYSFEVDSLAFTDIYGMVSDAFKQGLKVKTEDSYATVLVSLTGMSDKTVVVQMLSSSDAVVKETTTRNGNAEFYYVKPGTYYMRMFIDTNNNGIWDTGDYETGRQAETTYYYPEEFECKAKWDLTLTWNPTAKSLDKQKPEKITKQKPDKEKAVKQRNAERAKKKGIPYPGD
ncbi:MAG: hypothetical protein LUD48_03850, partial [Prevotella sp.]|nr:hypothetical protein [Prevotella sp.]